jgi:hypothetical protein
MPEEYGGLGDMRAKVEARVAAGEDMVEAAHKVSQISETVGKGQDSERGFMFFQIWIRVQGEVVETPGLPPRFDYEWFPQEVSAVW